MQLRDYQQEAVHHCYDFLQTRDGHPLIIIPTGGGKTPVIAQLCADAVQLWNGRVLVLAHVKELLEQTAGALRKLCPTVPVGVYSAGLKRRDVSQPVIVAGIQSVYDKADMIGRFDLVIVDEAHLIPPEGEGRYRTLLDSMTELNPDIRVIGLTATPYRLSGGLIYGEDRLFEGACYEVGVKHLVQRGFLSPLVGKAALCEIDTDSLKVVRGEFEESQAEEAFTDVVGAAVGEVVSKTADRKAVLLFCQTVRHGQMVAARLRAELVGREEEAAEETWPAWDEFGIDGDDVDVLADHRIGVVHDWLMDRQLPTTRLGEWLRRGKAEVGEVYGDTTTQDRDELVRRFRAGELRYLVNVNVLTTGFDAPNVDCVCLLRATVSAGLYYQMVGRGFRLHPGKVNCLVLDFGQNIRRHGPVDRVNADRKKKGDKAGEAVAKMCPECRTVVAGGVSVCPDCNYAWPVREFEARHAGRADGDDPLSTGKPAVESHEVLAVEYRPHTKKDAPPGHPKTLRVTYKIGVGQYVSEWVCVEHEQGSFARGKAEQWWRKRCNFPMPDGVAECVSVANHGLLAVPVAVTTKKKQGEKYPEISGVELGDKPSAPKPCPQCDAVNESVIVHSAEPYHAGRVVCGLCNHYLWPASAEEVERFGFYQDHHNAGLLPAGWEFDEMAAHDCPKCERGGCFFGGVCGACGYDGDEIGVVDTSKDHVQWVANRIVAWAKRKPAMITFSRSDLYTALKDGRDVKKSAELTEPLNLLVAEGHISPADAIGDSPEADNAYAIIRWLAKRDDKGAEFSKMDVFNACRASFDTVDEMEPALSLLEKQQFIRLKGKDQKTGPGRKRSPTYEVLPERVDDLKPGPRPEIYTVNNWPENLIGVPVNPPFQQEIDEVPW